MLDAGRLKIQTSVPVLHAYRAAAQFQRRLQIWLKSWRWVSPTFCGSELMAAVSPAIIMIVYVPDRLDAEYEVCACSGDGFVMKTHYRHKTAAQELGSTRLRVTRNVLAYAS
jgi:hypothetical protein